MPDLREEIREYVDAIEEPVSVDDVLAVVKRGSSAGERDGEGVMPERCVGTTS